MLQQPDLGELPERSPAISKVPFLTLRDNRVWRPMQNSSISSSEKREETDQALDYVIMPH